MAERYVLVTGNGFDVCHGLETKYSQFVEFTKGEKLNSEYEDSKALIGQSLLRVTDEIVGRCAEIGKVLNICNSNPFIKYFQSVVTDERQWIDCEQEIADIIRVASRLLNSKINIGGNFSSTPREETIMNKMNKYFKINRRDKEQPYIFVEAFESRDGVVNKDKLIESLRADLKGVITVLRYYLKDVTSDSILAKCEKLGQLSDLEFSHVINFNYTSTYRLYDVDDDDVFFIHGELDGGDGNMVLGTQDEIEDDLNFVYFKKYFQRIQKKLGGVDKNNFSANGRFDGTNRDTVTIFFGHSMSISDGDIIDKIFEMSKYVDIYYYSQTDYENKVVNLIEIFGKEDILKWVENGKLVFTKIIGNRLKEKLETYYGMFNEEFPMIPFESLSEDETIKVINDCFQENTNVYELVDSRL